jgi:hypothetical protein
MLARGQAVHLDVDTATLTFVSESLEGSQSSLGDDSMPGAFSIFGAGECLFE